MPAVRLSKEVTNLAGARSGSALFTKRALVFWVTPKNQEELIVANPVILTYFLRRKEKFFLEKLWKLCGNENTETPNTHMNMQ